MAMRREHYLPIPEEMRIWGGDDWLFLTQTHPNAVLVNTRFVTDMSVTSSSPEFQRLRGEEQIVADRILKPLEGSKWWHQVTSWTTEARLRRYKLKQAYINARVRHP